MAGRYLKDFKHSQTHCAHCLAARPHYAGSPWQIVNKIAISQLDMLLDDAAAAGAKVVALCRFCGDLRCKKAGDFFDIIGFKRYLFEQTGHEHGTVREYVVRLRRLGNYLSEQNISHDLLQDGFLDESGAMVAGNQHQ